VVHRRSDGGFGEGLISAEGEELISIEGEELISIEGADAGAPTADRLPGHE
jgi:hypothetical protein